MLKPKLSKILHELTGYVFVCNLFLVKFLLSPEILFGHLCVLFGDLLYSLRPWLQQSNLIGIRINSFCCEKFISGCLRISRRKNEGESSKFCNNADCTLPYKIPMSK